VCSVEQDDSASELNRGEKISGEFVVARGDGAKVLEFIEEALDEIALAIERKVASPRDLSVGLRRDHRGDLSLCESIEQCIGIVSLVAEQGLRVGPFEQRLCASQIMGLAGREHHVDGIAERIDQDMDFGG
jgi:hypothetical protein